MRHFTTDMLTGPYRKNTNECQWSIMHNIIALDRAGKLQLHAMQPLLMLTKPFIVFPQLQVKKGLIQGVLQFAFNKQIHRKNKTIFCGLNNPLLYF